MRQVMTRWLVFGTGVVLVGACALFAVIQN